MTDAKSCSWLIGCVALMMLSRCMAVAPAAQQITQAPTASRAPTPFLPPSLSATADQRLTPERVQPTPTSGPTAAFVGPTLQASNASETGAVSTMPSRQAARMEPFLAELVAAHRAQDRERLAALAGNPHIDLAAGTVRVILELDRDPEARPGTPTVETVITESGQRIEIHHAAPVAIRSDLAAAIAATGATYETANGDLVQVVAPFASLEALAALPDVRMLRLPYPAEH